MAGAGGAVASAGVVLALLLLPFARGWLGAGDVALGRRYGGAVLGLHLGGSHRSVQPLARLAAQVGAAQVARHGEFYPPRLVALEQILGITLGVCA